MLRNSYVSIYASNPRPPPPLTCLCTRPCVHAGDEPAADTAGDAAGDPQPDERENTSDQEVDDIQPSGTGSHPQ